MRRSRLTWFAHGLMAGFLVMAALNAVSYFIRSRGWGGLLRSSSFMSPFKETEALGFPFEIWRDGEFYGGAFVDYQAITCNALTALALGSLFGLIAMTMVGWLNRFVNEMIEAEAMSRSPRLQFSLRGMLLMTTVAAVVAALARAGLGPRRELLAGVYLLGPLFLILVVMIPRGMSWQLRVALLVPSTILLIWYATLVGGHLGLRFDRIVMGIYVCWVPQTVAAAFLLTAGLAIRYSRKRL